jgi:AraC-like DNA-binding protein
MEFTIILEGIQCLHYRDTILRCRPGDVWFAAANEIHGYTVEEATRNTCIAFSPDFFGETMLGSRHWLSIYAEPASRRPRVATAEERALVLVIGRLIHKEATERAVGWESTVRHHVLEVMLVLTRTWEPGEIHPGSKKSLRMLPVQPAFDLLYSRVGQGEPVALEEAAQACSMSRATFVRTFSQATGTTYMQFELHLRLSSAMYLLRTTDLPIEDIATRTGFYDRSHFRRHFQARYQMTPTEMRKIAWSGRQGLQGEELDFVPT